MWPSFKRFFTDELYFQETFGRWANWLRWMVVGAAGIILSGAVPEITTALGSAGHWGSGAILLMQLARQAGDRTPPAAKALAYADPRQLAAHLTELGVPSTVVANAATETAANPPPKV